MSIRTFDAESFAIGAHCAIGQKRKYTESRYCVHPVAVAELVRQAGGTHEMIEAAYLHDTVEDTDITIHVILDYFGPIIGKYVCGLTDVSLPEDGNRATRKKIDREFLAGQSTEVKAIKCADLIHNTASIVEHDLRFAKTYLAEKELILIAIKPDAESCDAHHRLWFVANSTCAAGLKHIKDQA